MYLLSALREAKFLGYKMFVENLVSSCGHLALLQGGAMRVILGILGVYEILPNAVLEQPIY